MPTRTVIHLGPENSRGGMSTVIKNLASNPPENWVARCVNTHSDGGILSKIFAFRRAMKSISTIGDGNELDIAHIHVTHGISWWRKLRFMKFCESMRIPSVIHVHSGRFEKHCSGLAGRSVRRALQTPLRRTVLLEGRWKEMLSSWIPPNTVVIGNFSGPICSRVGHVPGSIIKLLMLSRDSRGKGHEFAVRIIRELEILGLDSELVMTGKSQDDENEANKTITALGWISQEDKQKLIGEADFLIQPSKFEGSSMSVIEAMSSGLPALVSDASSETVGLSQLVLPLDSPRKWAEKIATLSEPDIYVPLVDSILNQAERFSPETAKDQWGALYEDLLSESNHGD